MQNKEIDEYSFYQDKVPYNIPDAIYVDICFNHKEETALSKAAFYASIGEYRKAQVLLHNQKDFTSRHNRQAAWLILAEVMQKCEKGKAVTFGAYLMPTLAYFFGKGKMDNIENAIYNFPESRKQEIYETLRKVSDPANCFNDVKALLTSHKKNKCRGR